MSWKTPLSIAGAVGLAAGAIGPQTIAPHDRAAKEPFVYAPPASFVESDAAKREADGKVAGAERVWIEPGHDASAVVPNVSIVRTPKHAPVEDRDVAALAAGMPAVFSATGVAWHELRHGVRKRPDGARVAFLEGSAKAVGGSAPYRVMQIAFPTNDGAAIVTASFPDERAADYERAFEASIDDARGVAFVAPSPPGWQYVAWGGASFVFAFVVAVAATRGKRGTK